MYEMLTFDSSQCHVEFLGLDDALLDARVVDGLQRDAHLDGALLARVVLHHHRHVEVTAQHDVVLHV